MNCYNGERYLREAIESVLGQTFANWEIVFWDNRSTDKSAAVFRGYADPRLRYFLAPEHTALGQARNHAVERAVGEWCAFLDCDDLWLPDKLGRQIALIEEEGADLGLVYGQMRVLLDHGGRLGRWEKGMRRYATRTRLPRLPEGRIFAELLKSDFIPLPSAVVRREAYRSVHGIDPSYRYAEDFDLFVKIAQTYKVRAVQDVVCRYRVHGGNSTPALLETGFEESLSVVKRYLPSPLARRAIHFHHTVHAVRLLKSGKIVSGLHELMADGSLGALWGEGVKRVRARWFPAGTNGK
jgi:glycosyltransferase involved in cell wall biosynthesis